MIPSKVDEDRTIKVCFKDTKKTYLLRWTEILTLCEAPFASYEDLKPQTDVLAPYYTEKGIDYSAAVVIGHGQQHKVKGAPGKK